MCAPFVLIVLLFNLKTFMNACCLLLSPFFFQSNAKDMHIFIEENKLFTRYILSFHIGH
jgi:hypothetical protein